MATARVERVLNTEYNNIIATSFATYIKQEDYGKDSLIDDICNNDIADCSIINHLAESFPNIFTTIIQQKQLLSRLQNAINNKYIPNAIPNFFDECIRNELETIGYNKEDIMRISWRINSFCLIYSRSNNCWCIGKIIQIYIDPICNKEWLTVKYGTKIKKIQRFCKDIKPIINHNTNSIKKTSQITPNNDGLTLHFYGIHRPKGYKSTLKLFENISTDSLITVTSSLHITDTIYSLKQLIRKMYKISINDDILIIFGDNIISYDNKLKLRNFGITNNSLLLLAICKSNKIERNIDNLRENDNYYNYTLSIKECKGFDIITQENMVNVYKMPNCGHYMNKESLFEYALNAAQNTNNLHIICPHQPQEMKCDEWQCRYCTFLNDIDNIRCEMCENLKPPKKTRCDTKWKYSLIKQILSISQNHNDINWINLAKLELLLSRNKIQKECDVQKCPKCETLYIENKNNHKSLENIKTAKDIDKAFKTKCILCINSSFCWCCGEEWEYGHICDSSFKRDLIKILQTASTKQIGNVYNIPSIRCCPNCCQLITHISDCKHMRCNTCNTDFCFVCLSLSINGDWQCGDSGDICTVAPPQNIHTLPDTIIINKKTFQLF